MQTIISNDLNDDNIPAIPVGTIGELTPPSYPVDPSAVAFLYARASRPALEGEVNRKTLTFTITPQTDQEWRDFLHTHTGTRPIRGKGISSPMVELAMQLLMAAVADFKTKDVAQKLTEISASPQANENLSNNLNQISMLMLDNA